METKGMLAGILAIVALVLLVISLFAMPWYSITRDYEGESSTSHYDYYLDHAEYGDKDDMESIDYDNETIDDDDKVVNTFETAQMIGFGGIVGALLAVIGGFAVAASKIGKKIGAVLVIIGLVIALIAPVYLMVQLPNAFDDEEAYEFGSDSIDKGPHKSFFGSKSGEYSESSWGPAMGWYLALASAIVLIISLILVLISSPESQEFQEEPYQEGPYQEEPPQKPAPEQPPEEEAWDEEEF